MNDFSVQVATCAYVAHHSLRYFLLSRIDGDAPPPPKVANGRQRSRIVREQAYFQPLEAARVTSLRTRRSLRLPTVRIETASRKVQLLPDISPDCKSGGEGSHHGNETLCR